MRDNALLTSVEHNSQFAPHHHHCSTINTLADMATFQHFVSNGNYQCRQVTIIISPQNITLLSLLSSQKQLLEYCQSGSRILITDAHSNTLRNNVSDIIIHCLYGQFFKPKEQYLQENDVYRHYG